MKSTEVLTQQERLHMTTNYKDKTNEELDRFLFERFIPEDLKFTAPDFEPPWGAIKRGENHFSIWNPTHKDSAQLQNYVFPKILNKGLFVMVLYSDDNENRGVSIYKKGNRQAIAGRLFENDDQINRTVAICCLEAWDKVERSK